MKARTATRFRSFRFVIAAIFAAVVAILALPGAASAATNPGSVTLPVTHLNDGSLLITLGSDFKVGDCTQFGGSSSVWLSVPDVNGFSRVVWTAIAQTSHTNHADVWHQVVELRTTTGFQTVNVGNMDGAQMTKASTRYFWQRTAFVHVENGLAFEASGIATLTGRC